MAYCWIYETTVALDYNIPKELPYTDYFKCPGLNFKLHIVPRNGSNQSTSEYIDKIRWEHIREELLGIFMLRSCFRSRLLESLWRRTREGMKGREAA